MNVFLSQKNITKEFSESSGETRRLSLPELATKDLCAQESKDAEEEKEEDEEGDDGLYRIDQGAKEVLEGTPVPAREPMYFQSSRYFLYLRFFSTQGSVLQVQCTPCRMYKVLSLLSVLSLL